MEPSVKKKKHPKATPLSAREAPSARCTGQQVEKAGQTHGVTEKMEFDEHSKRLLVTLSRDAAKSINDHLQQQKLSGTRFKIPGIDAVLDRYGCRLIKARFPEVLPLPDSVQEELGAKRMFILLFPEHTPMEALAEELRSTSYVEHAAPPPLRYAL